MVAASASLTTTVRIGLRPPGNSVSQEISRSPNQVMAAVRGMGVAVITSRCGVVPSSVLALRLSRCSTPNRCCSSITTKAKCGAWKVLENAACVATIMPGSPLAAAASALRRAASFIPPVSRVTGISAVTLEEETVEAPDAPIAPSTSAAASVSLAPGCARVNPDTILLMVS